MSPDRRWFPMLSCFRNSQDCKDHSYNIDVFQGGIGKIVPCLGSREVSLCTAKKRLFTGTLF